MTQPFLDRLAERPILADGAMGTMLYARGVPIDACFDVLNLHDPRAVQAIHREYVTAGARPLQTNNLRAHRLQLPLHGLDAPGRGVNPAGGRPAPGVPETKGRGVL